MNYEMIFNQRSTANHAKLVEELNSIATAMSVTNDLVTKSFKDSTDAEDCFDVNVISVGFDDWRSMDFFKKDPNQQFCVAVHMRAHTWVAMASSLQSIVQPKCYPHTEKDALEPYKRCTYACVFTWGNVNYFCLMNGSEMDSRGVQIDCVHQEG